MEDKKLKKEMYASVLSAIIGITLFMICDAFFKFTTFGSYAAYEYNFIFMIFFSVVIYSLLLAISKNTWKATLIRLYYNIYNIHYKWN